MIQQLSKQDHYDYGLRNLKAVLNMAGSLKRADPDMNVEAMTAQAMLMYDDAGILGDGAGGVLRDLPLDADELYSFVKKLFGTYNEVPYHNLWHAWDVRTRKLLAHLQRISLVCKRPWY